MNAQEGSTSTPLPSYSGNPPVKVVVITDSIAQVKPETARELGIQIVPFSMTVEGKLYTDLIDFNLDGLYQRMRQQKDLHLTTSGPSIGYFYKLFKNCLKNGADSLLYIGISSRLSRTYASAEEARKMLVEDIGPQPIFLYDSRLATAAQGFLAVEAARLAATGMQPDAIIERITVERMRVGFAAGLETLEYLVRGGRLGKAAYLLASTIGILPVISINSKGEVAAVSQKFGYHQVVEGIIRCVKNRIVGYRSVCLAVMQANAQEQADKLQAMAIEQFHPDDIYVTDFTPTMVAHTGPGIIGLAYHWKP